MRRIIASIFCAFVLMFTAACGGASEGTVYDKTFEPARDWTTQEADYQLQCYPAIRYVNGQPQTYQDCQSRYVGQKTVHHHEDECYRIMFKNDEGDKGDDCVGAERYETIEIGDWYEK